MKIWRIDSFYGTTKYRTYTYTTEKRYNKWWKVRLAKAQYYNNLPNIHKRNKLRGYDENNKLKDSYN